MSFCHFLRASIRRAGVLPILAVVATEALAQTTAPTSAVEHAADEHPWEFSLSTHAYFVPNERDYVQPTITLDHDCLHLEARYNYEDLDTTSAWVGVNFSGEQLAGQKLAWEITPMIGGAFGRLSGAAPGYKASLSWWKLNFYSEGEYFCDSSSSSDNFFYSWSELTIAPVEWLHFGFAGQRTKADHSDHEVEPGLVVGVTGKNLALSAYVFNPQESKPTVVLALSLSF